MLFCPMLFFMPQTLKKLELIDFGFSLHMSIRLLKKYFRVWKYISFQKIADPYFFVWFFSLCGIMPLLRSQNEAL